MKYRVRGLFPTIMESINIGLSIRLTHFLSKRLKWPLILSLLAILGFTGISQEWKKPIKRTPPSVSLPSQKTKAETREPYPWLVSTPEAQGLDSKIFDR